MISQLRGLLDRLKRDNELYLIEGYFKLKKEEILSDLLLKSGNLTEKDIISGNTALEIYGRLSSFYVEVSREDSMKNDKFKSRNNSKN